MATAATQDGYWLNRKRLTVYPRILLAIFVGLSVFSIATAKNLVDSEGKPFGSDFITFWAASLAALEGHAPHAYNIARLFHYEQIAVPASQKVFGWYYPPSFYLIVLPLALLPYVAAYWVWTLATLGCYVAAVRRVVQGSAAMWLLAGFSAVWINFMHGQNGFLTAALAGAGTLCLRKRPYLAGVFIGLLAIKPHLALLFPVALVAIGAWRTLATAAATAFALTAAGTAVLGRATLAAWVNGLGEARHFLENGGLPWQKMPTVFASCRLLGMPVALAYGLQMAVAVIATLAVWHVWRRCSDWELRGAALMSATFLISPYVFDYDLAWLAFPIAWLALKGMRGGWLGREREILTAAWIVPFLMAPIASTISLQIGPLILIALLWIVVRRAEIEEWYRQHNELMSRPEFETIAA